jgi:hypothetical protein
MEIIFAFTVFHFSSGLQFKNESSEEIKLNKLNQIAIANTLIIVLKLNMYVYVVLEKTTKNLVKKRKKCKYYLSSVKERHSTNILCRVLKCEH